MSARKTLASVLTAASAALLAFACALAGGDSRSGLENLMQSVVKIDVWEAEHGTNGADEPAVGSGAIISPDGYVITNAHVVNPYAEKIVVTLPCLERVGAKLVGWDHWTDISLLKLDSDEIKRRNLKFSHAQFGNSDTVKSPDEVYAVGTPYGCARTVTRGIISNNKRYFDGELDENGYETGAFNTWLQTDAAINPGNSGGPLALPDGRIIGINTRAAVMSNNLGFAVPSNVVRDVVEKLKKNGCVVRAYTGITLTPAQEINDNDGARGALVKSVDTGSPADAAGLAAGDVITRIDGKPVDGRYPEQLPEIMSAISQKGIGKIIKFEVLRGEKTVVKNVKTEKLESRIGRKYALADWGANIAEITKALRREKKLECESSVIVSDVKAGAAFDSAGLSAGDIILSIGKRKIKTCPEAVEEFGKLKNLGGKTVVKVLSNRTVSYKILERQLSEEK